MRDLIHADTFLLGTVEIATHREARLGASLNEFRPEDVGAHQIHHVQWSAAAMKIIRAALIVFGALEIRQHVVI